MVDLTELQNLSATLGADPLLVQAAGGNTSLKHDGIMWIKASGTWLKDAARRDIFVPVAQAPLLSAMAVDSPDIESCVRFVVNEHNTYGLRPSIETTVHALIDLPVVLHVHCVNTIAWAIQAKAEHLLQVRLRGFAWAYIPYAKPGRDLAKAIRARITPQTEVLVLGNHGLVVAGNSVTAAAERLHRVVTALEREARPAADIDRNALTAACTGTPYRPAEDPETHALATDPIVLAQGKDKVFYPDHAVFLGVGVATHLASAAPLVALPGLGVVLREDAKPAIAPMGRCLADVLRRVAPDDALVALNPTQIAELLNWDAEKYRQQLNANAAATKL
jgi:rhamnose utilization protein RhaD (predicted bifunctional aldolase and dehydrogenase)